MLFLAQAQAGVLADWLSNSGRMSMTAVRKLMNTSGMMAAAISFGLLATPWIQHGPADHEGLMISVGLLTCAIGIGGVAITGHWANYYDVSSKYSPYVTATRSSA